MSRTMSRTNVRELVRELVRYPDEISTDWNLRAGELHFSTERCPGLARQIQRNEIRLWIKIIFSGFIYYPEITVPFRARIG